VLSVTRRHNLTLNHIGNFLKSVPGSFSPCEVLSSLCVRQLLNQFNSNQSHNWTNVSYVVIDNIKDQLYKSKDGLAQNRDSVATDCCFSELLKLNYMYIYWCLSSTKQTSLSHQNVTCSHNYIAETLLTWH
jgi:hypothetical protein